MDERCKHCGMSGYYYSECEVCEENNDYNEFCEDCVEEHIVTMHPNSDSAKKLLEEG